MAKKRKKATRKKSKKKSRWILKLVSAVLVLVGIIFFLPTDVSTQYYDKGINGLKSASLKTAIHDKIRTHTYLNFEQNTTARYWWDNYFTKTDWHPDGYFWDMYSSEKHKTYVGGQVQAREHCMPRSWWGVKDKYPSYDANGDLHNLFPSDYSANSAKSNLPLGEVGIVKFDNGVSKVGANTYPKGYRGQVFEPADEYKGDFARVYFYMVTCYQDYAYSWRGDALKSMLQQGAYPSFQPWAIEMLLKWHRNDPVSEKEIKRNGEVYKIQGNRNPFVDYPDLAEYIWGNKQGEAFVADDLVVDNREPSISEIIKSNSSWFYNTVKDLLK